LRKTPFYALPIIILLVSLNVLPLLSAQELYWEEPERIVPTGARFPAVEQNGNVTVVLWHEFAYTDEVPTSASVSLMINEGNGDWDLRRDVIGPFPFSGEEVPFASVVVDDDGRILIAVSSSGQKIEIYSIPSARGEVRSVTSVGEGQAGEVSVSPKLFYTSTGDFLLCATQPLGLEGLISGIDARTLGINYAYSSDGSVWSEFKPLTEGVNISYVYLPTHAVFSGRDFIIFQGSPPTSKYYQLYMVRSFDGGRTWSSPIRITDETSIDGSQGYSPDDYDNQRPYLVSAPDGLHLAWERHLFAATAPQIYYGVLNGEGGFRASPQKITVGSAVCRNPRILIQNGMTYLLWFDNRKGENRIFLAYQQGISWEETDVSIMPGESMYGRLFELKGRIHVVWENKRGDDSALVMLEPDQSVSAPAIVPVNFSRDSRSRQDTYVIEWNIPEDSSGIAGFNYSVDRDPEGRPAQNLKILRSNERRAEIDIGRDGWWYFHIVSADYAGNWSSPATVRFYRDTTPPPPVEFRPPEEDDNGYLISNTLSIEWDSPELEDLAGYTYRLQYLSGPGYEGELTGFDIQEPAGRLLTVEPRYDFVNLDNGSWAFTVAPLDDLGNQGPARTIYFRLNKYIPVTYITQVGVEKDQLNRYELEITGRGFTESGEIQQVMLDRDGEEPYDYVYRSGSDLYSVRNDRFITGPFIEEIEEGEYRVGLVHPTRGTYFTRYTLSFESTGEVKFGDFTLIRAEKAPLTQVRRVVLYGGDITVVAVMLLLSIMLVFALVKLTALIREALQMRRDVTAILENRRLSYEMKKERVAAMERKGSLRVKFALLTTSLVLIIVLMVAVPLGDYMIKTQQKNLTEGLQESTRVLIESINAGAELFLPEESTIELGRLPRQTRAAEAAEFVILTGPASSSAGNVEHDFYDYLWATNDPDIKEKIVDDSDVEVMPSGEMSFPRGAVKVEDGVSPIIPELREEIDSQAAERVGELAGRLRELQQEARQAAQRLVVSQDQDTAQLLTGLQDEIAQINTRIEEELARISDRVGSVPEFKSENILTGPTKYVFYRPIVYQDSSRQGVYYHGMVRLGISTENIVSEIENSRSSLVRRTALIALGAIILGIAGALLLATIIIRPIRRLVAGVERIRDTEDKEDLKDHEINVRSKDEIAVLADTVNQMTKGLVNAAIANKDLIMGKDNQKMFIPLEKPGKRKLTTGALTTEGADFFGYYEGAKGVSGDYFDYVELTPGKYGMIKCDVAGKGVPASLIMVMVATIFRNYFNDWMEDQKRKDAIAARKGVKRQEEDPNIEELVYAINRLVEERGFEGRFAALIVVLLDTRTGKAVMCNAGDNIVHLYANGKHQMETVSLPQAPAAGVFSNDLVEMQAGFKRVPHLLNTGDIMLLFTDGLEEAQRFFRDENFKPAVCAEPGIAEGELHDNHQVGTDNEEFGLPRVYDIVNALMGRGSYTLRKHHNPVPNEELVFDFSACQGTIEEVVIALVSIEKVFRMYPDPSATENDVVVVDRKIADFLEQHFKQYGEYFHDPVEETGDQSEYVQFCMIKEDSQYDDLTVLGVMKK